MKTVYPDVLDEIQRHGHEIGIHGRWHEYLSSFNGDTQGRMISAMKEDFSSRDISGANFIGRMNNDTARALISSKIKYLVHPALHSFFLFDLIRLPTVPFQLYSGDDNLWLMPVSVETYGRPWFAIRRMLDSAISESRKTDTRHITILLHPFRDGNLRCMRTTERLMDYLVQDRRMKPLPLNITVSNLETCQPETAILFSFTHRSEWRPGGKRTGSKLLRKLWQSSVLYFRRVGTLFDTLHRLGKKPVLVLEFLENKGNFAVYPFVEEATGREQYIRKDPLVSVDMQDLSTQGEKKDSIPLVFYPRSVTDSIIKAIGYFSPRKASSLWYAPLAQALIILRWLKRGRAVF
ncbi:hypothetical protein ACFLV9_00195 [Chloroflexota bacterium]